MPETVERRLQDLLRGLAVSPSAESVEERLAEVFRVRIGYGEVALRQETRARHLVALERVHQSPSNGHSSWLARIFGRPSGRASKASIFRRALPIAAALTAAAILTLVWLAQRPASPRQDFTRDRPAPRSVVPESPPNRTVPRLPERRAPREEDQPLVRAAPARPDPVRRGLDERPPLSPIAALQEVGRVLEVVGEPAQYVPGGAESKPLKKGSIVVSNSRLETGAFDRLVLQFRDGSELRLGYRTTVEIPPVEKGAIRPASVRLTKGQVWAKIRRAPEAPFRMESDFATATVLGTEFGLTLSQTPDGKNQAKLTVLEGRVDFASAHGRAVVGADMECRVIQGGPPEAPSRINRTIRFRTPEGLWAMVNTYRMRPMTVGNLLAYPAGWTGIFAAIELPNNAGPADVPLFDRPGPIRVFEVERGSAGDRAGVRRRDRVLQVNGRPVNRLLEFFGVMFANRGIPVTLDLERDGRPLTVTVTPGDNPANPFAELEAAEEARLQWAHEPLFSGYPRGTIERLEALLKTHPSAAVHNDLAVVWIYLDRYDQAEPHAEAAVRMNPDVLRYRWTLTWVLEFFTGDLKRAEEQYLAALRMHPDNPDVLRAVANFYRDRGNTPEREKYAERARALDPDSLTTQLERAALLAEVGKGREAMDEYRRLYEAHPESYTVASRLAPLVQRFEGPTAAEPVLIRAEEIGWHNAAPHVNLGLHYQAQRRYDLAEREFRHLLTLDPQYPAAWWRLGNLYAEQDRTEDAIRAYEANRRNNPAHVGTLIPLAQLYVRIGELDKAEALYREILATDPIQHAALIGLCDVLDKRGERVRAIELLLKGLGDFTDNLAGLEAIGQRLMEWGRPDRAEDAFRRMIALATTAQHRAISHWHVGRAQKSQGEIVAAEASFRKAIEADPNSEDGHTALGILFAEQGRREQAKAAYEKAHSLRPQAAHTNANLGRTLSDLGDLKEGERYYRKALELNPRRPYVLYILGVNLRQQDRLAEAIDAFEKSIQLDPGRGYAHLWLGQTLADTGRNEEAEATLRKGTELLPKEVAGHVALANVLHTLGRYSESEAATRKALELRPGDPDILTNLGRTLVAMDRLAEAEAALRKSIDLYKESTKAARSWYQLGLLFEKQKEPDKAKEAFRKVLSLIPDSKEAAEALRRLGRAPMIYPCVRYEQQTRE